MCLLSLARRVFGDDTEMGSQHYQLTSLAVLRLEAAGLVTVERRYRDEAQKANIIDAIQIT
jgi:hypothetical protein